MARKAGKVPTVSSYFQGILTENPEWLALKSNDPIRKRWNEDHGGQDMSAREAGIMTNVKSKLRREGRDRTEARPERKKPGPKPAGAAVYSSNEYDQYFDSPKPGPKPTGTPVPPSAAVDQLERLEIMIDNCLSAARAMNVEHIEDVIRSLRQARNGIVLMFDKKS